MSLDIKVMLDKDNAMYGTQIDLTKYSGKKIVSAKIDDGLILKFEGGGQIKIFDDGQCCCESRYATCDDSMENLIGGYLVSISSENVPDTEGEYGGVHGQCFVKIQSSVGGITMTTHNEHNGYYGGFCLSITEASDE